MPATSRAYPFPFRAVLIALLLFTALPVSATVQSQMPDFYAEPGLNPFRDPLSANVNEVIDTFSGGLHLSYTDLVIPGNGGLDIRIQRSYNANNIYLARKTALNLAPTLTTLLPRTPVGMGWTLHFGRVLKSEDASGIANVCDAGSPGDDTLNNAILELPDGSQQILYVNSTAFGARFITREQWVADCITGGLLVTSPEGVKYTMTQHVSGGNTYTTARDHAWYTTRIEDRNGNYLTLNYLALSSNKNALISSITASDGRAVNFGYLNSADPNNILLSSISANAQTWRYEYTPNVAGSGHYQLTRVTRPDGLAWTYQYHNKTAGLAGNKVLQQVTYPYGATVNYDYSYVCFMGVTCTSAYDTFYSLVVATKTNGGRDVVPGTWTYSYAPTTTEDTTTVTFPGGRHVYKHFGSKLMFGGATTPGKTLWKIGLLKEQQTYHGATLINRVVYTWDAPYAISNERYVRPPYDGSDASHPRYEDSAIYVPLLVRKDIIRDGTPYTTVYSNFATANGSFNPQTITETGQVTRTTQLTYFPRIAGQNIVRLVKDETEPSSLCLGLPCPNRNILRTFDTKGNATQIVRHGVREEYSYYANGDLYRKTDARNVAWNYAGYVRGIPTNEVQPAGITLNRTVNPTGTIATETNGRGYTTTYTYDRMNRLASIGRPLGTPTTIAWNSTGRTVTRGPYSQTTSLDGFGRISFVNTSGVTQDINYNALGFKSFASYPSSTLGDSYTTDVLGRVTAMTHGDGTTQTLQYLAGNRVSITNERNYPTTLTYRAFGDPDNQDKVLMQVSAPEGITTTFTRNILGQPLTITQGGITRTYGYNNTNNFLTTLTQPEIGTTTFGRDAVGNMTSRQVGGSGVTLYTYDGQNRLSLIDYPGATPDVTQGYDPNNNLTLMSNGGSRRDYSYDANDNLKTETLTVGSLVFPVTYAYNNLDYVSFTTYPSLRQVFHYPDALGRPTLAWPYINAVTYWPNGIPQQLQYANGQVADLTINTRQWIGRISAQKAGIGYAMDLAYGYDGLANVTSITNTLDSTDSKTLSYDGVDRLISAGTASVSYDSADNITSLRTPAGTLSYTYANNRLSSVSGWHSATLTYDLYGNVINNGRNIFAYDDASNLRNVTGPVGTIPAAYDYDGNNKRVRAAKSGKTTYFLYARNGDLLGEYNAVGVWVKEYAYLGGKLVTTVENIPDVAPGVPASLSVPATSTGSHTIAWGAASGTVTRYELQEATTADFSNAVLTYSGTALSWSTSGKVNPTYYYRVRACSGTACGAYRAGTNAVVVAIPVPGVPASLTVPATNNTGSYSVTWGAANGVVTRYELYEATNNTFTGAVLAYSGLTPSATITGKLNGTYYYRVRACNGTGCSADVAGVNGVMIDLRPGAPNGIAVPSIVVANTGRTYNISFGAAAGTVTSYRLEESTNPEFPPAICTRNIPPRCFDGPVLVYQGPNLLVNLPAKGFGTYYYRVQACNQYGCGPYTTGANGVTFMPVLAKNDLFVNIN